jgi:ABC-type spermidine/putrescine transport system permease subunit II
VKPEINAICTVMITVVALGVTGAALFARRARRRAATEAKAEA